MWQWSAGHLPGIDDVRSQGTIQGGPTRGSGHLLGYYDRKILEMFNYNEQQSVTLTCCNGSIFKSEGGTKVLIIQFPARKIGEDLFQQTRASDYLQAKKWPCKCWTLGGEMILLPQKKLYLRYVSFKLQVLSVVLMISFYEYPASHGRKLPTYLQNDWDSICQFWAKL